MAAILSRGRWVKYLYNMYDRELDRVSFGHRPWPFIFHRGNIYPVKYAHNFVAICFVVVLSFLWRPFILFYHILLGCFQYWFTLMMPKNQLVKGSAQHFQNYLSTENGVMNQRDFARFSLKRVSEGVIFYIYCNSPRSVCPGSHYYHIWLYTGQ